MKLVGVWQRRLVCKDHGSEIGVGFLGVPLTQHSIGVGQMSLGLNYMYFIYTFCVD